MADYTSILTSKKEAFINTFVDAYYWNISGIPLTLNSHYDTTVFTSNIFNIDSQKTFIKENFINTFVDAYYWGPSGIPLSLNSSYYTFNVTLDNIVNVVSKKTSIKEDFINIFEDAYYWAPSGIPLTFNSSYVSFNATTNIFQLSSSESDTLTQQLPIPSIGGSVGVIVYFLRARDSSLDLSDPLKYVYWVSDSININSYIGTLPGTGPLVDLVIMSKR